MLRCSPPTPRPPGRADVYLGPDGAARPGVYICASFALRLLKLIIFMFTDLGLLTQFDVAGKKFVRFLLAAHGMYRNVHYHSFYHAFDATHFMYLMIRVSSFCLIRSLLFQALAPDAVSPALLS